MTLYKNKYRVESTRLKGWDYSSNGYYFITVCTKNRECLLGDIKNDAMQLNKFVAILYDCWFDLTNHYKNLQLDAFVIMPNHFHGIMIVDKNHNDNGNNNNHNDDVCGNVDVETGLNVETGLKPVSTAISTMSTISTTPIIPMVATPTTPAPTDTKTKKQHGLFEFVRALKTFSARRINKSRNSLGISVWQPRFYDRIVRNDGELNRIRKYIVNNPQNWLKDENYLLGNLT